MYDDEYLTMNSSTSDVGLHLSSSSSPHLTLSDTFGWHKLIVTVHRAVPHMTGVFSDGKRKEDNSFRTTAFSSNTLFSGHQGIYNISFISLAFFRVWWRKKSHVCLVVVLSKRKETLSTASTIIVEIVAVRLTLLVSTILSFFLNVINND